MSANQADLTPNEYLLQFLQQTSAFEVLGSFCGIPAVGSPQRLNETAVVCIDAEWWQKEPKPTTELGIAELMQKGLTPTIHAENILSSIQVPHARIIQNAHLTNRFPGAGDPGNFLFGKTKFVTMEEVKQVLINAFVRPRECGDGSDLQPIILVGHAVENEFEHMQRAFGVDLLSYGTIVKFIDTQLMAPELAHFNMVIPNLHTAGNDAAATLMAAVLLTLKPWMYPDVSGPLPAVVQGRSMSDVVTGVMEMGRSLSPPPWGELVYCIRCDHKSHSAKHCHTALSCQICSNSGVKRLFGARNTHKTTCLYQFLPVPPRDYGLGGQ
ncbi:hypothetical protein BKA58DRAFT_422871 [Alternaria rosae]|uniref:uncharacterized protein n=1 Tax=Alternaria rosae TaxID=1187941 RepID=UPI001E8DE646|nr:uncharacterized protein BKA58DRAFT_422871 [Alternaria rosae]KAH6865547.1 hypothetical protein BKA58DRAFT_422871 [Alternaria rosae]